MAQNREILVGLPIFQVGGCNLPKGMVSYTQSKTPLRLYAERVELEDVDKYLDSFWRG